jgi:hypothetical protein
MLAQILDKKRALTLFLAIIWQANAQTSEQSRSIFRQAAYSGDCAEEQHTSKHSLHA